MTQQNNSVPQGYVQPDPNMGALDVLRGQVAIMAGQIVELQSVIKTHAHNGVEASNTDFDDLLGMFDIISAAPTDKPTKVSQQIRIYVNGATLRLYWYDKDGDTWHYVTATA